MDAVRSLFPYAALVLAGWLAYGFVLEMWVNEQTAALILPDSIGDCGLGTFEGPSELA